MNTDFIVSGLEQKTLTKQNALSEHIVATGDRCGLDGGG